MSAVFIADSSALQWMFRRFDPDEIHRLTNRLTRAVDGRELGFPKEVVRELQIVARDEHVTFWASGHNASLRSYRSDIVHTRTLMRHVRDLGYEDGFESLEGGESSTVYVGRLACQYESMGQGFTIVTEDLGEGPLGPTMEQLCRQGLWTYCSALDLLSSLGLDDYIR